MCKEKGQLQSRHLKNVKFLTNDQTQDRVKPVIMISEEVSRSFHINSDNNVPMVSMPNALLGNDACQSDAVRQECRTQVYEKRPEKSLADVNHTQV